MDKRTELEEDDIIFACNFGTGYQIRICKEGDECSHIVNIEEWRDGVYDLNEKTSIFSYKDLKECSHFNPEDRDVEITPAKLNIYILTGIIPGLHDE